MNEKYISDIVKSSGFEYVHMKAIEECNELATVLMQKLTKFGSPKAPDDQSVIDEIGDVEIACAKLRILYDSGRVDKRVREKLAKQADDLYSGKYKHI